VTFFPDKRILVTGGAGFIGSHLCERLLAQGQEILCVDNFFSSSRHNVAHILDDKHMELMRHDVTFPLFVEVDEIFNLACPASPRRSLLAGRFWSFRWRLFRVDCARLAVAVRPWHMRS